MRTLTHSILAAALSSTLLGCGTEEESSRRVQEMDARGQLIRLSVGLEDLRDLKADLEQAFFA